jgi:hypothetical protein
LADQYDLGGLTRDGTATGADRARLERIDQSIWNDIHVRAHRLRLELPQWAVEHLGPIPEAAGPRRVGGVFAARLEQHEVAYGELIDHQAAFESHRELVDDILDQRHGDVPGKSFAAGLDGIDRYSKTRVPAGE